MAIQFDTTAGGANSTSYVSLQEFKDYLDTYVNKDNLPNKNDDTLIKNLLNKATKIIDREEFHGYPTDTNQALEWPRIGTYGPRGYAIDKNTIPLNLKNAFL